VAIARYEIVRPELSHKATYEVLVSFVGVIMALLLHECLEFYEFTFSSNESFDLVLFVG
jgi:hypothetical protein